MKAARGKRWAIGAAVAAAVCVAAGAYAFRGILVEEWYLWDLDSKDQDRRLRAALALAEMRSARGALHLLERDDALLFGCDISGMKVSLRTAIEDLGPEALPSIGRARGRLHGAQWGTADYWRERDRLIELDLMAGKIQEGGRRLAAGGWRQEDGAP